MARTYTLFVNESLIQADTRLVVTIDNVNYGNLFAGIRYGALPGYANDNLNLVPCALTRADIFMDQGVSNTGYLIVNHCDLVGGLWYIGVQGPNPVLNPEQIPYFRACHDIEYTITAQLVNLGIPITEITPSQSFDELTITYYGIDRFPDGHAVYNFYSFPATLDVTTSFGQVRLANITNGYLSLRVKVGHLATDLFALYNGTRNGVLPLSTYDQIQSGSRPCTDQQILDPFDNCGNDICLLTPGQGCSDAFCSTGPYVIGVGSPETQTETSCAVYVPECTWAVGNVYIVVQALDQFDQTIPITYSLLAEEYSEALLLTPNEFVAAQATDNNWEYQFYQIQQPTVSSARVRVQIASGDGVWVTLTDAPCSENVTYTQSLWCHAHTPNVPFECDINIPTRASHPGVGHTNFYIAVYGGNATYAITYYEGRENCHQFQGLGVDDGLRFCAGLVPYSTWRWTNYTNLDNEASCLFEELYGNFRVQPCWSGVTGECNLTLQRFACFESFHRCDQDGFAVGTCRGACEAVVYECVNWFESVDLEHYNCTSSRYIDESFGACTGRLQQDLRQGDPADIDDPYYILYEASNNSANLGSSLSVLLMIVLATLAQLYFAAL
jgi:hypothetical protein